MRKKNNVCQNDSIYACTDLEQTIQFKMKAHDDLEHEIQSMYGRIF